MYRSPDVITLRKWNIVIKTLTGLLHISLMGPTPEAGSTSNLIVYSTITDHSVHSKIRTVRLLGGKRKSYLLLHYSILLMIVLSCSCCCCQMWWRCCARRVWARQAAVYLPDTLCCVVTGATYKMADWLRLTWQDDSWLLFDRATQFVIAAVYDAFGWVLLLGQMNDKGNNVKV